MLTVDQYVDAVEASGAPIVSIAGGELTLHPQIVEFVSQIISQQKRIPAHKCVLFGGVMQKIRLLSISTWMGWIRLMISRPVVKGCSNCCKAIKVGIEKGYRVTTSATV